MACREWIFTADDRGCASPFESQHDCDLSSHRVGSAARGARSERGPDASTWWATIAIRVGGEHSLKTSSASGRDS